MPINIKSTSGITAQGGIKCCIYGNAGVGKTSLAATAPKPVIISAERGLLSLHKHDLPYIEVKTLKDVDSAYNLCRESDEYETIFLDTLTEVSELLLALKQKEEKDGRAAYGRTAEAVLPMIRRFRDLSNKNVVFICRMIRKEDDETGTVTYEPNMPGRLLPYNIPYMVDELFVMTMDKKGKRVLQTQPDRKFEHAKDRSGELEMYEEPNLSVIFDKILKGEQ